MKHGILMRKRKKIVSIVLIGKNKTRINNKNKDKNFMYA